ncbi:NACHT domain-containing protein [Iningainema tapete]|uniref:Pentapeptide repeat-containing protein n=1 Tax=Iningainema tapete BLCC-T55 TaxID=2748662 RepID=A0A8J6XE01_9CYAN|nr:pentapeptide repeat-containing protein [Iningainema tapete]MBD2770712.1 pentapeptide repeat-containing protein [Iningainema tapete BLCC-T55]
MSQQLSKTWKRVTGAFSAETVNTTTESAKAVLELGKTLKEQGSSIEVLKPLLSQSSSLLEVLCSPEVQLLGAGLPFVAIATTLLKLYREKTRQELSLEECVVIVTQAAYLESFKEIISEHQSLLTNWKNKFNTTAVKKELKKLDEFELDTQAAEVAISSFPNSQLAKEFNHAFSQALQQVGQPANEAEELTQQVARNTERHFFRALAEARDSVKPLVELYNNGGIEVLKKYDSIRNYLEKEIADKPRELVFEENFSFADIYVKPKVRKVDSNGKINDIKTFCLENWAKNLLLTKDPNKQEKVIFIQGGPGRGKSIFCRMFADLVRRDEYRRWIPILIRLRDIDEFQLSFKDTLRSRINESFAENPGWLSDAHIKFLFILDGFDELRIERSNNQSVKGFIRQVGSFQRDYANKHRVIITGRGMALHGIDDLPDNLERVEIAEMDSEMQNQWFTNWRLQFDTQKTTQFQQFLQDENNCPEQVSELAKEPLLLYMLAAMHRDDSLDISKFEQATSTAAKILIYEQALNWVLTKQRSDKHYSDLNYELTRQKPEALRRLLAEAAVCVVQSGGESASIEMVRARLEEDDEAKKLITIAEEELGKEALKNTLCAFYLKPNQSGGVEFFHKSFREFLCAERLKESLEEWTELGRRGKTFNIDDKQLYEEIYDLLGYGGLTPEIVEYLMGLLTSKEFLPEQLFQRLEYFYHRWCDGEFIDSTEETLPQKKARQLQKQGIKLGQRQVDTYAGLNVMILLLELHRYAQERDDLKEQIVFRPCGKKSSFDSERLLRVIGCSYCISTTAFIEIIRFFLSGAYLSGANLSRADLSGANLSGADLRSAYLRSAYFKGANLSGAYLSSAYLSDANLSGANLSRANLSRANLRGADLTGADLTGADLTGADLTGARNLTSKQVKATNNWEQAIYDREFREKLGLSLE